jgi:hypothetical protein
MNTGSVDTVDVTEYGVPDLNGDPRVPWPERTKPGVCIVGFADGHRHLAPFHDPDLEFWGLNRLHVELPDAPWSRWFELHSLPMFYGPDAPSGFDKQHIEWMRTADIPIYVRSSDLHVAAEWQVPTATPYPLERATAEFRPYFTNSVSWLLAMAIAMGFEAIHMYGVDMAQDSVLQKEYREQRPSCEYFIGLAEGKGVPVYMPANADLLVTSHLYGFDDGGPFLAKRQARMVELAERKEKMRGEMNAAQNHANQLQHMISQLDGALQENQYQITNLGTQHERH